MSKCLKFISIYKINISILRYEFLSIGDGHYFLDLKGILPLSRGEGILSYFLCIWQYKILVNNAFYEPLLNELLLTRTYIN